MRYYALCCVLLALSGCNWKDYDDGGYLAMPKGATDSDLAAALKGRSKLDCLQLYDSQVTDAGLAPLARIKWIGDEQVTISSPKFTGSGLQYLGGVSVLDLDNCANLTEQGMAHMDDLKGLGQFFLTRTNVTDGELAHIPKNVWNLCLFYDDQLTDAGLEGLREKTALKELYVRGCPKVTESGLDRLKKALPGLEIQRAQDR
ncbi:MAG: hypothetical protein ABSA67_02425 [Candidatus Brocadiia bacterium]|jgi:hypothetical protein